MDLPEELLIDRIQVGDREAFKELVSQYRGKGFGLTYSIVGNTEDAKDVLQDSFVKVYNNISRFRKGSSFYTWFYRIVVNTARDFLRMKARQKITSLNDNYEFKAAGRDDVMNDELSEMLDRAIDHLPDRQSVCFKLKHMNGLKIREIADFLKCRPSTVKIHLYRAVRSLKRELIGYKTA